MSSEVKIITLVSVHLRGHVKQSYVVMSQLNLRFTLVDLLPWGGGGRSYTCGLGLSCCELETEWTINPWLGAI